MRDAESRFAGSTRCAARTGRRPSRSAVGYLTLLALGIALFAAVPANAASIHKPAGTFELQSLGGPPGSIAVDEQTDSVYVNQYYCCTGTGDIEKFDAEGNKSNFSALGDNRLHTHCEGFERTCYQITVDNTGGPNQGVIYVSTMSSLTTCCPTRDNPSGGIQVYLSNGEYVTSIYDRSQSALTVRACGVGVDENGDLIVAHGEGNTEYSYLDKIDIEDWSTHPEQETPVVGTINSDSTNPCKTAVDSNGFIYSQTGQEIPNSGAVRKRDPTLFHEPSGQGAIPTSLRDPSSLAHEGPDRGFAFDSEDNLYGLRPSGSGPAQVQKVDQAGSLLETFGAGELLEPMDIALNKASGTVYVTDGSFEAAAKDIHIFKAFKVPDSTTGAFAATGQTTGTLSGQADPVGAGEVTGCQFEYTTEALFNAKEFDEASTAACVPGAPLSGAAPTSVSAPLSGLTLEETYFYRLKTENSNGASNGTVRKFVPHGVIDLTTKAATNVAPKSATVNASFNGNGDATEYYFEVGHSLPGVYIENTPAQSAGSPNGPTDISAPLTGLELETTYHYRVVAVNSTGTSKGFDESFTTPPAVANLVTEPATAIGQTTVTLNGKFTGNGHDTHYYFEYGKTSAYGQTSEAAPGTDAGTTTGPTAISSEISDYYGYTTYHYRVVASNEFGVSYGKDVKFSTEPAPLPNITETAVSEITPTTATFSALVSPNRWDASWLFEWGESTEYDSLTELEDVLIGVSTAYQPVSATIEGLKPATVYHYRAVAFNFTGATNGTDQTFITPDVPKVVSASASAVSETTAHLSALVLANSSATNVHFEFGPSIDYGASTVSVPIGSEPTLAHETAADLTGLAPGTTYHYRVVGSNGFGASSDPDRTFTTQAAPPPPPPPQESKKCPKGKVKRHGRCVKKKHRKHRGQKHKKNQRNGSRHG